MVLELNKEQAKLNKLSILVIVLGALCFFPQNAQSQAKKQLEVGGLIGGSYYIGDLNPGTQFKNTEPSFTGILRVVLDERYALKASVSQIQISGEYPTDGVVLPTYKGDYKFNRSFLDLALQVEFNFLPYDHWFSQDTKFSPFISLGLGATGYERFYTNSSTPIVSLNIPFGVGFKYKLTEVLRLGVEWNFRKMFVDDIDCVGIDYPYDLSDPYGYGSDSLHNNDWYSFAGVSLTIALINRNTRCNGGGYVK